MTLTMTAPKAATVPAATPQICTVLVWFGEHVIMRWENTPERCAWYAAGMRRRFAALRVTDLNGNDWVASP